MEVYKQGMCEAENHKEDKTIEIFKEVLFRPPQFIDDCNDPENGMREFISVAYDINGHIRGYGLKSQGYRSDPNNNIQLYYAEPTVDQICILIARFEDKVNGNIPDSIFYLKKGRSVKSVSEVYKFKDVEPFILEAAYQKYKEYQDLSLLQIGQNLINKEIPPRDNLNPLN